MVDITGRAVLPIAFFLISSTTSSTSSHALLSPPPLPSGSQSYDPWEMIQTECLKHRIFLSLLNEPRRTRETHLQMATEKRRKVRLWENTTQ